MLKEMRMMAGSAMSNVAMAIAETAMTPGGGVQKQMLAPMDELGTHGPGGGLQACKAPMVEDAMPGVGAKKMMAPASEGAPGQALKRSEVRAKQSGSVIDTELLVASIHMRGAFGTSATQQLII